MSMKFLSGLQDLLGLYDSSSATGGSPAQSPSSPIPPQNGLFVSAPAPKGLKKSPHELNQLPDEDSPIQRCSHDRNVRFNEDLITGFSAAPTSPFHGNWDETGPTPDDTNENVTVADPQEILLRYRSACERYRIAPSQEVERQIGYMHRSSQARQESLSLKGERVSHAHMEALEEVFRRAQFDSLNFEYTFLDDDCLVSLSEMLEFYDSAVKLNLSFNRQIGIRGWSTMLRAIKNCSSLQVLNLRYTSIERAFPALCRCLRVQPPPCLTSLHLENVALSGKNILLLSCALKTNTTLKELYLGENQLQPTDGAHLHQLITSNTTLQMLDLRNNELGDAGMRHLCDALRAVDTCAQSGLTALVVWNNRITSSSMEALSRVLQDNPHVETLNIGSNPLGVDGLLQLKHALANSVSLHRLGLQNTKMNCQAAIVLAECLADNDAMVRVDLRDNPGIGSAGLLALHSAMKMNHSITLMNLDQTCAVASSEKEEFQRYFDEIRVFCERNKQAALNRMRVNTCPPGEEKKEEGEEKGEEKKEDTKEDEAAPATMFPPETEKHVGCQEQQTPATQLPPVKRITRSSSLTCAETVADINERIRVMTGSTHSLESTNLESSRTIKKFSVSTSDSIMKAEWGSLPAIPQAVPSTSSAGPSTPVVRKMRRFSVSPSSSTIDVATTSPATNTNSTLRPSSLAIGIPPRTGTLEPSGPSSAPISMSLPSSLNLWSSPAESRCSPVAEHPCGQSTIPPTSSARESEAREEERLRERQTAKEVRQVVCDLINYVVYEECSVAERKASILLGTGPSTYAAREITHNQDATPSRIPDACDVLAPDDSDEAVVSSTVRQLVRDVMRVEKEQLRLTLERRRRKMGGALTPSSAPGTPI